MSTNKTRPIVFAIAAGFAITVAARATDRYVVPNTQGCCHASDTNPNCTGVQGSAPFCTIEDAVSDYDTV